MNEKDKIAVYEMQIEDMLRAFQERLDELENASSNLSEFDEGRLLAYTEVTDIIKTRYSILNEILTEAE